MVQLPPEMAALVCSDPHFVVTGHFGGAFQDFQSQLGRGAAGPAPAACAPQAARCGNRVISRPRGGIALCALCMYANVCSNLVHLVPTPPSHACAIVQAVFIDISVIHVCHGSKLRFFSSFCYESSLGSIL